LPKENPTSRKREKVSSDEDGPKGLGGGSSLLEEHQRKKGRMLQAATKDLRGFKLRSGNFLMGEWNRGLVQGIMKQVSVSHERAAEGGVELTPKEKSVLQKRPQESWKQARRSPK